LRELFDIDPAARELVFNDRHYRYNHLILAIGSGNSYFGREPWRQQAPPMKILEQAVEIRRRLLSALEEAKQTLDGQRRHFLQSVVMIGGDPSGCELAGSLSQLTHHSLPPITSKFVRRRRANADPGQDRHCPDRMEPGSAIGTQQRQGHS